MLKVMTTRNDPTVEGFIGGVRLAWAVHLMLVQDGGAARETISNGSSNELGHLSQCLEVIFSNNVFQFLLDKVLRTAAYQVQVHATFFCVLLFDKIIYSLRRRIMTLEEMGSFMR